MICQPVPASLEGALERDCFELNRRGCWLTSPRLRGEVGFYAKRKIRVRGTLRELNAWKQPLTPTLSPQERGEGEVVRRFNLNSSCSSARRRTFWLGHLRPGIARCGPSDPSAAPWLHRP